jgi:hypothetical protein
MLSREPVAGHRERFAPHRTDLKETTVTEADTVVANPWASKIRQHEAVAAADPELAFDLQVFADPADLTAHLAARRGRTVVLRPEISDDTGSAVRRCCIKRSSRSPAAKLLVRSNSAAQLGLEDLDKAILLSGLNPD